MISHALSVGALVLGAIIAHLPVAAHGRPPCTKMEARQAEVEAGILRNWTDVYSSYKRFAHCDDGAIAEGYSDSIGQILAHKWNELPELTRLTRSDRGFEDFVIRHVDATLLAGDLKIIADNAVRRCAARAPRLCQLLGERALAALKEIR